VVRYRPGGKVRGRFAASSLEVRLQVAGKTVTWHFGDEDKGNLRGTTRTLDGVKGPANIEPGLVSRDGWAVVDDSQRPLFDNSDWPWVMERSAGDRQDLYFFGHGHAYKDALGDYVRVAGRIPLPPRFAFGTWWSRYWSYTDLEFKDLVREFHEHNVPLDVLVIDMDWHLTFGTKWWENKKDQSGHTLGWTGYTWNKTLFPDPAGFLKWVGDQGLKKTLNMHPASGVQPHEEQYPEMARAMGIDPATKKYVPFDITDKKFAENYMKVLHHPLQKMGVDFFWLDWQQESKTRTAGVNPTWWLNYVHFTDMERGGERPLIYHRWGGLGNHRYQVGFSGDTVSDWASLAFQPYFTATAANVGYGYWSHDIGGHLPGPVDPELYARWIQFGVFSPILRTHTTKDPKAERRIWAYPADYAKVMRDAFLLRYSLIPYIYTAGRTAYDTGLSLLRPLYYDWPEAPEAYTTTDEYLFGDDMIVSPIAGPIGADTATATKTIWLPPGEWVEWFTGARLQGPATVQRSFTLGQIPVYVRAGAIVPMQPEMRNTREKPVDPLILTVFPGRAGQARVYDDAGESLGYKKDEFAWTSVRQAVQPDGSRHIEVLPEEGRYPGMPTERGYEIRLPGALPPASVTFLGRAVPFAREDTAAAPCWRYDGRTLTTTILLPRSPVGQGVSVVVVPEMSAEDEAKLVDSYAGKLARLQGAKSALNDTWPKGWSPDSLVEAMQTASRIDADPKSAARELRKLDGLMAQVAKDIRATDVDPAAVKKALARLGM
jgi:alpha-glucosidase